MYSPWAGLLALQRPGTAKRPSAAADPGWLALKAKLQLDKGFPHSAISDSASFLVDTT
jgi:hypothetical protein